MGNSASADFVHLHVHSQYSLLDGASRLADLVAAAKKNNMPAVALTDHGNMYGAIDFYREAEKAGVKPIIGMEAYIAPESRLTKEAKGIDEASFHLILLAKDIDGYRNLMKLSSIASLEGFYYRPRIDKEVLAKHSKGLICLSSCLQGEVSYWLNRDDPAKARKAAGEFSGLFPKGDYYLEIQDHGIKDQRKIIPAMLELGKEMDIKVVATNDLHYLEKGQARAHETLLCIQTQTTLDDPKRFKFETDEFYFKSADEMKRVFGEIESALLNTREIAEKSNIKLEFGKYHLPHFTPPEGKTEPEYLDELVKEGLAKRYPRADKKVHDRLAHELGVISKTGFISYFLIVWDFIRYARSKQIPVGPGRGSAAGSVVSYCLGITDLDPIEHDLIFERFLNPDRISMPDIDIDFCYERRGEVIDYVSNKYGKGNVAQIITFGTMQAKAVVRDVARAMGFSYPEADKIAKMIPFELNMTLKKAMEMVPDLRKMCETDGRVKQLIETSQVLEGLTRHASTHAAGVVIADGDLTDYVPLVKTSEGLISTGYSMDAVEKIGLLKMDFLGLRTLTVLDEAAKLIRQTRDIPFDQEKIPLEDAKTYAMLGKAECTGVFQLESSGMRDLVRRLKPDRFEDLVALVALFRPGPLGSGMVDDFIRRRHGQVKVAYDHPKLEPSLKDTYGVYIYQEQVMRIANELAGFTLGQADMLRRAMGKKTPEVMEKARGDFVNGCVKNGVDRQTAEMIFDKIEYFAGYAFNRSHSAAYALISYRTAYLKANYPVEFMTALLTSERENTDKIAEYIEESRRMNIAMLPPDVNASFAKFTVEDGGIRYGLLAIKNVGEKAIESIIQVRKEQGPYKSLVDFCERVDTRTANKKVIESLIKVGAFDSLKPHRAQLLAALEQSMEVSSKRQKEKVDGQLSFFDVSGGAAASKAETAAPTVEDWTEEQRLGFEKALLGFYLSGHPLSASEPVIRLFSKTTTADLMQGRDGMEVMLGGVIGKLKVTVTKKSNERMAIFSVDDFKGSVEALAFPKIFPQVEFFLREDAVVFAKGRLSMREESPRLLVDEVIPIDDIWNRKAGGLFVQIDPSAGPQTLADLKKILAAFPGPVPVELLVVQPGKTNPTRIAAGPGLCVTPSQAFVQKISELLGPSALSVKKR